MFQPRSDPRAISLSVLFLTARPVCLLSLSTTGWFYFEPRVPSPSLLHLLCSCLCQSLAWPPAEASCPWLTPSQSAEALPHWVMSERCLVVSDSCNPLGCSPLGSSVHGILQARILEWPFPSPGNLPDPRIEPGSSALQADIFTIWATRKAPAVLNSPLEARWVYHSILKCSTCCIICVSTQISTFGGIMCGVTQLLTALRTHGDTLQWFGSRPHVAISQ